MADVRRLLAHLPQNNLADAPFVTATDPSSRMDTELDEVVPDESSKAYDMHEVIRRVVDDGGFLEIQPMWAGNMLIGFARLGGRPVGIVGVDGTGDVRKDGTDNIRLRKVFFWPVNKITWAAETCDHSLEALSGATVR